MDRWINKWVEQCESRQYSSAFFRKCEDPINHTERRKAKLTTLGIVTGAYEPALTSTSKMLGPCIHCEHDVFRNVSRTQVIKAIASYVAID